jgi:hypothetical protein
MMTVNLLHAGRDVDVDAVVDNYLLAAVWTGNAWFPEDHALAGTWATANPAQLDDLIDADDLTPEVRAEATEDVRLFLRVAGAADVAEYVARSYDPESAAAQLGHDLLLTRNGHGAGFWDRGLGELGERLSMWARSLGGADLDAYLTATCDPDDLSEDDLAGPVTWR